MRSPPCRLLSSSRSSRCLAHPIGSTRIHTARILALGVEFTSVPNSANGALTHVRDRHARASPARVCYFLDPIPTPRLPLDCSRPKGECPSLMYISLSNHPLGFIAKFTTDSTMMLLTKANS